MTKHIAPGTIPERKPRPLTDEERKALREANGGFATAKQLAKLATPKPEKAKRQEPKRRDSNGWGK